MHPFFFVLMLNARKNNMQTNRTYIRRNIWQTILPNAVCYLFAVIFVCCNQDVKNQENTSIISSKSIVEKLSKNTNIVLKGKTISDALDFLSVNTQKFMGSVYIEPIVCFINCTFEDNISACTNDDKCIFSRKVVFKDCLFKKGVCFQNAEFRDDFSMDFSKIEGVAKFDGAIFRSKASFNETNFKNNATFSNAVFCMVASFHKSFFKNNCIFHYARFNNIAKFMESYFYGYTDFSQIFSSSILDFTAGKFSGETTMSYSTLLSDVLFNNCQFKQKVKFADNAVLGEIKLRNIAGKIPDISSNKMFNN